LPAQQIKPARVFEIAVESAVKLPARVYSWVEVSVGDALTTKKPLPEMAISVDEDVVVSNPC